VSQVVSEDVKARVPIALAITAALFRLVPLQFLHPLNWDEIEFFQAARWIGEGRVPFRDFWEHHTPLAWFVFAPFTWLTDSPGAGAILLLRWAQIPVWMATFWLANVFMRNAGLSRFARWSAMALGLCSSLLMTSAVEFRLDPLSCALYMAGLVLWQLGTPRAMFGAGAMFCLTGLTNMRLGPLLVVTVLLLFVIRERKWGLNARALWIAAGGVAVLAMALSYFAAMDSLDVLQQQLLSDNVIGDKYGPTIEWGFAHRLLVPLGVRLIGADRFDLAAVDLGGIAVLLIGLIGIVIALHWWRAPDGLFVVAVLQIVSISVIARMNFIYNYHFQIVVVLMIPLIAAAFERVTQRGLVLAALAIAWCVNAFASVFRGKELDLAYQDFLMREVHARTSVGDRVWSGIPWALRREPAYRFWFLPDMTRQLVTRGHAPPYRLSDVIANPPATVVADRYALIWMTQVQPELGPYFVRHYMPVWRHLWVPAMNVRLEPGAAAEWSVPRDGSYRVYASPELANHPWFRNPFGAQVTTAQEPLVLTNAGLHPDLQWSILFDAHPVALRKGQRLGVRNGGSEPLGVILLPTSDTMLFRQPPPGATLEAATSRVTHVPSFRARIHP
jgi:hypothetical protein